MEEQLYKVCYHYENIPHFLQKSMSEWFINNRSKVVEIFNGYIDGVNSEWELSGEPYSCGEFSEDINPAYVEFIQNKIQPLIDYYINRKMRIFKFKLDEYANIVGYIPFIKNSKIYITLKQD